MIDTYLLFIFWVMVPSVWTQDIRMPASLTRGPPMLLHYKATNNVTLFCEGVGYPGPIEYEWRKNGEYLNVNTGNIQMRPGVGTIDIRICTAADEGYYQCRLGNAYGLSMSNVSFVQMALLETFPPTIGVRNSSININDKICLLCQGQPRSIPTAQIYWTFNITGGPIKPQVVQEDSRIQTDPFTGSLCFTHVQLNDGVGSNNKVYICNADNSITQSNQYGSHAMLIVGPQTVSSYAPGLMFGSASTLIGLEGDPLVLRSFFFGSPVPDYTWRKNGATPPPDRWVESNSRSGLTLQSGKLITSDAGEFTCQGTNSMGSYTHTIQLIVQARPVFLGSEFQPHDMNVTDGETAIIRCEPRADPNVTVKWFKNRTEFNVSSLPPKFSLSPDMKTLTIADVCKTCNNGSSDLMTIQCNATNDHGYAFAQGYINVLVATKISSTGGDRPWTPYHDEVFDCQATSDDSTPITRSWYYNDLPVQENQSIYVAANGSLILHIQNDTDGGQSKIGSYKCIASNGYSQQEIIYNYGEQYTNDSMMTTVGTAADTEPDITTDRAPASTTSAVPGCKLSQVFIYTVITDVNPAVANGYCNWVDPQDCPYDIRTCRDCIANYQLCSNSSQPCEEMCKTKTGNNNTKGHCIENFDESGCPCLFQEFKACFCS